MHLTKVNMGWVLTLVGFCFVGGANAAGPYDGTWNVNKMVCGGEPANAATKSLYTPPNSIAVLINGETGAFLDTINGCQKRIPLIFTYPSPTLITASFSGLIECTPANCASGCGLFLPLSVAYEVEYKNNKLEWDSIGPIDENCTQGGQSNPIHYTMHRR